MPFNQSRDAWLFFPTMWVARAKLPVDIAVIGSADTACSIDQYHPKISGECLSVLLISNACTHSKTVSLRSPSRKAPLNGAWRGRPSTTPPLLYTRTYTEEASRSLRVEGAKGLVQA